MWNCLPFHVAVLLFHQGCLTSWVCFQSFLGALYALNGIRACEKVWTPPFLASQSALSLYESVTYSSWTLFTSVQFHQPKGSAGWVLMCPSLHALSLLRFGANWLFCDLSNLTSAICKTSFTFEINSALFHYKVGSSAPSSSPYC